MYRTRAGVFNVLYLCRCVECIIPVQVFEAVLAWVHHAQDQRESLLPELLSKIRLPLCQPQFLADRVQQDDLVRCCHKCRFEVSLIVPVERRALLCFWF